MKFLNYYKIYSKEKIIINKKMKHETYKSKVNLKKKITNNNKKKKN